MEGIIASTYEVIGKLGSGGGGNVYLARHLRLDKKVVLKADKRKLSTPPELLRREVDVLKNLRHPNIPQVYDFFVENDTVYTVMDYIQGESLDKALKRGEQFSQAQVVQWAAQLLEALVYLHSPTHGDPPKGFLHSDIKPANIMLMPDGNICLIDFNIALALGEENVIGCSAGYSSPEHYGLDFSVNSTTSLVAGAPRPASDATVYAPDSEATVAAVQEDSRAAGASTVARVRTVMPDVRSDIYSTGATLYHLLSGRRPDRDATRVEPLSPQQFSPQVVEIITKAMQPNPDKRFQSAEEMLQALVHLRDNDPRVLRLKRQRRITTLVCLALVCCGVGASFVGLKRLQTTETRLKLAEYALNALDRGDTPGALENAMQAFQPPQGPLAGAYVPQAQAALAQALGVYDLGDTFRADGILSLPSAPLSLNLSPDGTVAACPCSGSLLLFDTGTRTLLATLPTDDSALAEAEFLDNDRIVYAGADGLCAYRISTGETLWQGEPATGIALSADGSRAAAVYRDESLARVYDTATGQLLQEVDFGGKKQKVAYNDIFANPNDNLFCLNRDGSLLAASFEDGSLYLYNLAGGDTSVLLDAGSGQTHFEGGFSGGYFAFSAAGGAESVFAVIDTATLEQTGGYASQSSFGVQADETGICVQTENVLVRIDPVTGDQTPLVTTAKNINAFRVGADQTVILTDDSLEFYDAAARQTASYTVSRPLVFAGLGGTTAIVGGRDTPEVRVLTYEDHADAEVLTYDPAYDHDEMRLSEDGNTLMAFSYTGFRIYSRDGTVVKETELPNPEQIYDQQYRRQDGRSYLEVFYYDGTILRYDAAAGTLFEQDSQEPPSEDLYEEFLTDTLRIESTLHGTPTAYDRKTGREVAQLDPDAYLTYVTQVGDRIVVQYVTTTDDYYGQILDEQCRVLAELPDLCDVTQDTLLFDYPGGHVRQCGIYDLDQLLQLGQEALAESAAKE